MPQFTKGNTAYLAATGQGQSDLPKDVPPKFVEGFLDELDGRAEIVKTLRRRFRALINDLGGDGLSYQEKSLAKRAVHLERVIEKTEAILVRGGTVDMNVYLSCINIFTGVLNRLGMRKRAKTLSLKDYLTHVNNPAPSEPQPQPEKESAP